MAWTVNYTDRFLKQLKKLRKNSDLLLELDNKMKRLSHDPRTVGGRLSGALHGSRSTRLVGKYRLIFTLNESARVVHLVALDHRQAVYD